MGRVLRPEAEAEEKHVAGVSNVMEKKEISKKKHPLPNKIEPLYSSKVRLSIDNWSFASSFVYKLLKNGLKIFFKNKSRVLKMFKHNVKHRKMSKQQSRLIRGQIQDLLSIGVLSVRNKYQKIFPNNVFCVITE